MVKIQNLKTLRGDVLVFQQGGAYLVGFVDADGQTRGEDVKARSIWEDALALARELKHPICSIYLVAEGGSVSVVENGSAG